jgi:hypothetical protein
MQQQQQQIMTTLSSVEETVWQLQASHNMII